MGTAVLLLLVIFLLVLLAGILIGMWLARRAGNGQPPPAPLPGPCPPEHKIPDRLGEADVTAQVAVRLAGSPANGVPIAPASGSAPPAKVVWIDHGNEVLVHLDSAAVQILDRVVIVSVDLETDQTGRTPLVCSFAVGGPGELGGLIAATDDLPRGLGSLASCWGQQLQSAVWSSLMSLASDHATERNLTPRGLAASAGTLHLTAGEALTHAAGGAA
ncbi:MAG TPA: hypothetical protein VGL22_11695 [Terracidiphilus sp.]|jgi:hypothetical protein